MDPEDTLKLAPVQYLKDFWTFVKPYRKPLRTVYILYFFNSLLNLVPALSIRYYIDLVLAGRDSTLLGWKLQGLAGRPVHDRIMFSLAFIGAMALLIVGANAIGVTMWRRNTRAVEQVVFDIKTQIYNHINKLSLSYFNKERVGSIMTKAVGDTGNLSSMLRESFTLVYSVIQFLLAPFLMLFLSPPLFLIVLIPAPFIFFAFYQIRTKLKPMYRLLRENESVINSQVQEIVSGIREIKAFNMEDQSSAAYRELNRQYYDTQNQIMRVFSFNHQLQYGAKDFGIVLICALGGMLAFLGIGNITVGTITSFLLLTTYFYTPIGYFVNYYNIIQRGMVSLERIMDFLHVVPDVKDRSGALMLDKASVRGQVAYDHVCFSYNPDNPVLDDICIEVTPGEKVAVVGPTGSGKSTMLSLMLRFYDVNSGCIRLDGRDIRDCTQSSLRQAIGIVFQETFLFYGTIRDNLLFTNPDRTEEDMIEACKMANIYDTIMEFPDRFCTTVGERGVTLSGGQKQRLAIARVMLKDPAVVILDEATSSVDTVTEKLIQEGIDALLRNRTAFIIAHRLTTVKQCSRIIVLNNKRIAETGTHDELLAKRGIYYTLHENNRL
jgi:ABC-type multidrug transport system fused ATPase/permease subunit